LKFDRIQMSRSRSKFGRIQPSRPRSKFGRIQLGWLWSKFGRVSLNWNFAESVLTQIWSHRPRQKTAKFYGVDPMDTSFRKFNLNLFYEKWILDFEIDSNIWIWI